MRITLRAGTYLVPSIPVEFFEAVLEYLESELGVHTTLLYESKLHLPRLEVEDPFASGYLDIAWMTSSAFLKLKNNSSPVELLPIAPVHKHAKGEGCYTDIIIHKDLSGIAKELIDLRGYGCAHDELHSFNSHHLAMSKLREVGESYRGFFSNVVFTGSHIESIKSVIAKKVEVAAVDANSLAFFLEKHPNVTDEIEVLTSWGPLPPYACVVRSVLQDTLKSSIYKALGKMKSTDSGAAKLKEFSFNIDRFAHINIAEFIKIAEKYEEKDDSKSSNAYY